MSRRAHIAGATVLAFAVAGAVVACASSPNTGERTTIYVNPNAYSDFQGGTLPSGVVNQGVVNVLALKCGGLDCHGAIGRPFRIFSQYGLRLVDDAGGDVPGGARTTLPEVYADYISTISVQPELTSKVFYGLQDPHALILLRKPLNLERHKGGPVMRASDPTDLCITSWLQDGLQDQRTGKVLVMNNDACNTAAKFPP